MRRHMQRGQRLRWGRNLLFVWAFLGFFSSFLFDPSRASHQDEPAVSCITVRRRFAKNGAVAQAVSRPERLGLLWYYKRCMQTSYAVCAKKDEQGFVELSSLGFAQSTCVGGPVSRVHLLMLGLP